MSNPFTQNDLPLITNTDYYLWRDAYQGGSYFRDKYLQSLKEEKFDDFCRRKAMAPTTDFAKAGINRILAQVSRLLADVIRRGGNEQYQQAVAGHSRGVDGRGSSMNAWLTKIVLPELLVIGRVGALVDAPAADDNGDVPEDSQPYFCAYRAEQIQRAVCADPLSPSDYKDVLLQETDGSFVHYYMEDNLVYWQKFAKDKSIIEGPRITHLGAIPFAICDLGSSLMASIAPYQVSMLNAASREMEFALNSNLSILTLHGPRNWSDRDQPAEVKVGATKGITWKDEKPEFISTEPKILDASGALAQRMQADIQALLNQGLDSVGGIELIVLALEAWENRLADFYAAFYELDSGATTSATIEYPTEFLTSAQKLEIAEKLFDLAPKVLSNTGKHEINKRGTDLLLVGHVPAQTIETVRAENDKAPYAVCDPAIVAKQRELDIVGTETAAESAGLPKDEHLRAKEDRAESAAALVKAQAQAKHGADELEVNPEANAKAEKAVSQDGSTDLTPGKKVRGESQ